jgi:acyl carrier protein
MSNKLQLLLSKIFDLNEGQISDDLTRDDVSKWDSLTHMELVTALESEFMIALSIDEIMKLDSVRSIKQILKGKDIKEIEV